MALATGKTFEEVTQLTPVQFRAMQEAVQRHWQLQASMSGVQGMFGGGGAGSRSDDTSTFERKVAEMKKATGKDTLDLWGDIF